MTYSKLLQLINNTWNYVQKKLRLVLKCDLQNVFTNHTYKVYTYKDDLALNNLQWLICHKTQLNQIMYI